MDFNLGFLAADPTSSQLLHNGKHYHDENYDTPQLLTSCLRNPSGLLNVLAGRKKPVVIFLLTVSAPSIKLVAIGRSDSKSRFVDSGDTELSLRKLLKRTESNC